MRIVIALAATLTCVACASQTEMGTRAYASGNYGKAYERWAPAAAAGDAAANYNMGLLWQQGLTTETPKNAQRAGEFFMRASGLGMTLAMGPAADFQIASGNTEAALTWLNLGARWNDPGSIERLRRLGAPIPAPDLAIAQQQVIAAQQQAQAANAYVLGQAAGCALGGGCALPPIRPAPTPSQLPPRPLTCRAEMMRDVSGNPVYRCR